MAELFTLLFGKSKKNMRPIMIDKWEKCEKYMLARQNVIGFHRIVAAPEGSNCWKQKTSTVVGNKNDGRSGYISKNGFQPHT